MNDLLIDPAKHEKYETPLQEVFAKLKTPDYYSFDETLEVRLEGDYPPGTFESYKQLSPVIKPLDPDSDLTRDCLTELGNSYPDFTVEYTHEQMPDNKTSALFGIFTDSERLPHAVVAFDLEVMGPGPDLPDMYELSIELNMLVQSPTSDKGILADALAMGLGEAVGNLVDLTGWFREIENNSLPILGSVQGDAIDDDEMRLMELFAECVEISLQDRWSDFRGNRVEMNIDLG